MDGFTKFCVYIDGSNLPENCEFQLEQVVQGDGVDSEDFLTQYRLKPAEDFGKQVCCSLYIYFFI